MTNKFTWETYDGTIADMRRHGHTLQQIGDRVGITRERVRQILEKHYGKIAATFLNESALEKLIGCQKGRIKSLRERGILNPQHRSWFYLYDRYEAEKAMLALQRNCKHCGEPLLLKHNGIYCPGCQKEYRRYTYPFLTDEMKRRANLRAIAWMKNHPEKAKEIQKRADRRRASQRASKTRRAGTNENSSH